MNTLRVETVYPSSAGRVVDLFSGVGGLSLGAARAGFTVHGAVDNDARTLETHSRNFPGTLHLECDISALSGRKLRDTFALGEAEIDGIIGGPPCQGFSTIGRRNRNDDRNRSFVDFFRVVAEVGPKFFLAENVPGIVHSQYQELRDSALGLVGDAYTLLAPMKIAANKYGAATNRTRVFFFGFRPETMDALDVSSFEAAQTFEATCVADALDGLPISIDPSWQLEEQGWQTVYANGNGFFGERLQGHVPPGVGDKAALERLRVAGQVSGFLGTVHSKRVGERYRDTEQGRFDPVSRAHRLSPNGLCPTLRAGTGPERGSYQAVRPIHPTEPRVITPREGARLQGFPDWFQFHHTKWHSFRQIGNSVSPLVAERILAVVARALH